MRLPKHAFISYSRRDQDFAIKLSRDLEEADIPCWMDTSLVPGTPNWQTAIREAVNEAFATVVIISQNVLGSEYVQGELGISLGIGRPVVPVWIEGENWYLSAPMELHATQFTDMRVDKYEAELPKLIGALRKIIAQGPRHVVLDESDLYHLPDTYFAVELPQTIVGARYGAYDTFNVLTDDLYRHYLLNTVPPYTYGSKWLLASQEDFGLRLLALPWEWLLLDPSQRHQPLRQFYPDWGNEPLADYGIEPGSRWIMMQGAPGRVFGVAGRDGGAMKDMKWIYSLLFPSQRSGIWQRPEMIPMTNLKHRIVMMESVHGHIALQPENQAFWDRG